MPQSLSLNKSIYCWFLEKFCVLSAKLRPYVKVLSQKRQTIPWQEYYWINWFEVRKTECNTLMHHNSEVVSSTYCSVILISSIYSCRSR